MTQFPRHFLPAPPWAYAHGDDELNRACLAGIENLDWDAVIFDSDGLMLKAKLCPRCKTKKPLDQFYERRDRPNGRSPSCTECERKRARETQNRYRAQAKPDVSGTTKTCAGCGTEKPIKQFNKCNATLSGYSVYCKPCAYERYNKRRKANLPKHAGYGRKWRANNKERFRDHGLKANYGIPLGTYAKMLEAQGGKCAICGTDKPGGRGERFHIDHDHATGAIRGLLCHGCNVSIGHLHHDVNILRAAIKYLLRTLA
jgi:hypothetical protein